MKPSSLTQRRSHPIAANTATGTSARASDGSTRVKRGGGRRARARARGGLAVDTRPAYQIGATAQAVGWETRGRVVAIGRASGARARPPATASGVAFAHLALLGRLVFVVLRLLGVFA